MIVLGLVVGIVCGIFNLSYWIAIAIILFFGLVSIANLYYTAYASTNMARVRTYLAKHQKDPLCAYLLTLETGDKGQEIQAMDRIIAHYRQPFMKNTYEMNKAVRLDDLERAKYYAEQLGNHPFSAYGKALIAAIEGKATEARSYTLKHDWGRYAVEATIALQAGDEAEFKRYAELAVSASKGMQRFSMIHSLKNMENESSWSY